MTGEKLADRRIPTGKDFLAPEAVAALTPAELVARVAALKPMIAAASAEAERLRRPVDEVWDALRATGYFYMYVPRKFGGLEFDPQAYIDATLEICEACPSTGWTASFAAEHNWLIAQFPEQTQAEVWGRTPYVIAPSVAAPPGKAVRVDGGFRISGRWKFGTVVMHADWVMLNAMESMGEGKPPVVRMVLARAEDVKVLDTWFMSGMAATGSNDIVAEELFVPEAYTFVVSEVRTGRGNGSRIHDNPLYSAPMLPQLCVTAALPSVGAARAAVELSRRRLTLHTKMGGQSTQVDKPAAQMRLARADLLVRSAELSIRQAANENLTLSAFSDEEQLPHRLRLRAQIAYAVSQCLEAVRTCCDSSGSGLYALDNPMQRILRDIEVMASHIVYDMDVSTELHGRSMVGLPPNSMLT